MRHIIIFTLMVLVFVLSVDTAFAAGIPCRFDQRYPIARDEVEETKTGLVFTLDDQPGMRLEMGKDDPHYKAVLHEVRNGKTGSGDYFGLTALVQMGEFGPEKLCGVVASDVANGMVLDARQDKTAWVIHMRDDVRGEECQLRLGRFSKCVSDDPAFVDSMVGKEVFFSITESGHILHCGW